MGCNISDLKKIKEIAKEFFEKTTFEVDIELQQQQDLVLPIKIKAEDPQILIGEGGQTLADMQHLLRIMFRKQTAESFYLDLDINDYKKKKHEYLKETARSVADEVSLTRKEKSLTPMSAQDRRIVHMELAGREDVASESIGEEQDRRVVIRPRS